MIDPVLMTFVAAVVVGILIAVLLGDGERAVTQQDPTVQPRQGERQKREKRLAARARRGKLYQRAMGLAFILVAAAALIAVTEYIPD